MKRIIKLFFLLITGFAGIAQDLCQSLVLFKEGTETEYTMYDAKNKITGKQVNQLVSVSENQGEITSLVRSKWFDPKNKLVNEIDLTFTCKDNTLYIDLSNQLNPQILAGFQSGMELEVSGVPAAYPHHMKVGDKLEDADVHVNLLLGGSSFMKIYIKQNNQKVTARESISTAAGEFDCWRIEGDSEVKAIFKSKFTTVQHFNTKVGIVKSVNIDNKGKVSSTMVLSSYKQG